MIFVILSSKPVIWSSVLKCFDNIQIFRREFIKLGNICRISLKSIDVTRTWVGLRIVLRNFTLSWNNNLIVTLVLYLTRYHSVPWEKDDWIIWVQNLDWHKNEFIYLAINFIRLQFSGSQACSFSYFTTDNLFLFRKFFIYNFLRLRPALFLTSRRILSFFFLNFNLYSFNTVFSSSWAFWKSFFNLR